MAALLFILILVLAVCIYLLILQSRDEEVKAAYADSQVPLSFSRGGSESLSNVSRRSPYAYTPTGGPEYPPSRGAEYAPSRGAEYAPYRGGGYAPSSGRQSPFMDMSGYSQYHQSDV